jgi:hypothetical protein
MSEVGTPNANIQRISDGFDATQVGIHLMPIPMDLVDRALARVGTDRRGILGVKMVRYTDLAHKQVTIYF